MSEYMWEWMCTCTSQCMWTAQQDIGLCPLGVRVGVQGRGRRERILMTPPLFQIGLYYHASIFVEFENVRHYHMYSKVYSNTLAALSGYWRKPTPQYTPMSSLQ